jgi:hypothetical protein
VVSFDNTYTESTYHQADEAFILPAANMLRRELPRIISKGYILFYAFSTLINKSDDTGLFTVQVKPNKPEKRI